MLQLTKLPLSRQHSVIVLAISLLALLAQLFYQESHDVFAYQRDLIAQGQVWRIFTGHLLHTNSYHLLLNLSALWLLWALHGHYYHYGNYAVLLIFSALITSLGLYLFSPELTSYVGLSGILHGVFIWGAITDIRQQEKTGYLLLLGVILKVAHEQFYGADQSIAQLIDANVAIDAHLWGCIGGLIVSYYYWQVNKKTLTENNSH